MRVLLASLTLLAGCGDPVRGVGYYGDPLQTFSARLLAPPPNYQPGDLLFPMLREIDGHSASGDGTEEFRTSEFPRSFTVKFNAPPRTEGGVARLAIQIQVDGPRTTGGVAEGINHAIVYDDQAADIHPFGPSQPAVHVDRGFTLIHRACAAGTPDILERVPLTTVVDLVPITHGDAEAEYRARCAGP
jgi:hypothetical protein